MCHLQPDSRISLILAAGAFDIILESLDVCSTDHLANWYPSKCTSGAWCSEEMLFWVQQFANINGWSASAVSIPRLEPYY